MKRSKLISLIIVTYSISSGLYTLYLLNSLKNDINSINVINNRISLTISHLEDKIKRLEGVK